MTRAHINTTLATKNRVLAADEHTTFLAHYDLTEHDVLRGVKAIGESESALFGTTYFIPKGQQYKITNNITMSAWVYPTAAPTNDRGTLFINSNGYYFTVDTSYKVGAYWYGKSPAGYHTSTGTCPLNTWTHIAVVWDDVGVNIYINGVLDTHVASTGTGTNSETLYIGSEFTSSRHFKGKVNELGIWAGAKTAEQIREIMRTGIAKHESGLRGFWTMNEGEGEILRDSSSFHQDIFPEPNRSFTWAGGSSVFTLRKQEGKFGGGIAIEEGTTNLANTENNRTLGFHTGAGNGSALAPEKGEGWYKFHISSISSANHRVAKFPYLTHIANTTRTYSVYFDFADTTGYYLNVDGTTDFGKLTDMSGQRYAGTYSRSTDGDQSIFLCNNNLGATVNDTVYYKFYQVEEKAFVTSFVDGSRPITHLNYPTNVFNDSDFTMMAWVKPIKTSSFRYVFSINDGNANRFNFYLNSDSTVRWEYYNGTTAYGINSTNAVTSNNWSHIVWRYSRVNNEAAMFVNGVKTSFAPGLPSVNPFKNLYLGIDYDAASNILNGIIDEVRIDKVARTDEEILAWYESNSPFWPRGIYRKPY